MVLLLELQGIGPKSLQNYELRGGGEDCPGHPSHSHYLGLNIFR